MKWALLGIVLERSFYQICGHNVQGESYVANLRNDDLIQSSPHCFRLRGRGALVSGPTLLINGLSGASALVQLPLSAANTSRGPTGIAPTVDATTEAQTVAIRRRLSSDLGK